MEKGKSERGFSYINFTDYYGMKCSISKSSLASKPAIWFGIIDAEPKIKSTDAHKFGIYILMKQQDG